jgi:hypothetical protein
MRIIADDFQVTLRADASGIVVVADRAMRKFVGKPIVHVLAVAARVGWSVLLGPLECAFLSRGVGKIEEAVNARHRASPPLSPPQDDRQP